MRVEHVGLAGRYSVTEEIEDGDLEAMARLYATMKPGAVMLLTVPVGRDAVFAPMTRIYGNERLPRLVRGFTIETEDYWTKDDSNRWIPCSRETALLLEVSAGADDPLENFYGLGCLVLRRPVAEVAGFEES